MNKSISILCFWMSFITASIFLIIANGNGILDLMELVYLVIMFLFILLAFIFWNLEDKNEM